MRPGMEERGAGRRAGSGRGAGTGRAGEEAALRHLTARGLRLVARNWRCRYGEIDLILEDGPELVFAEVKTRRSTRFGTGAEAVGHGKQARLRHLAQFFLQGQPRPDVPCRFDVVEVTPDGGDGWQVRWLRGAF